ncbi:MAG: N-6 DNA methylase, partial [bacterium]
MELLIKCTLIIFIKDDTNMDEYKTIENSYYTIRDIDYRKDRGQIFTPLYVARLMTDWVLKAEAIQNNDEAKVIDPAVGLGAFFQTMVNRKNPFDDINIGKLKIYGYEKDYKLSRECKKLYQQYSNIVIQNKDYLLDWGNKLINISDSNRAKGFDGIICNPP